ncbi:aldehyde ferredoxin oxidoreductase C-terminal domain-containing protein [Desulfobacula sp.]|uniref:aldehyde ferredoxin oxidoreductase family protein n=1 Tax=Desulfobacula sp. TaxID=2593537 RepID=UPI0026237501|nr:aldehyde ferredoxin oxidoreductase C-terminal domain-containing protein [Desulfobacula sp.]
MGIKKLRGYTGKLLRVDLTDESSRIEYIGEEIYRKYIGGAGLGIKILYDEVPPKISWSDPGNRLVFATGPLNGTSIPGSGTICAVSKGCLTNGGASSQANGFFGAYLKLSGLDVVVIQGAASNWKYLYIHDGKVEIKNADHLLGKNTDETEQVIKDEFGKKDSNISVYSIGPAGENLVKYAMISGDRGHVLAHNGLGAIAGSKKLKAIAVERGKAKVLIKDPTGLAALAKQISKQAKEHPIYGQIHKYGTSVLWPMLAKNGLLPVKNLTTNIFPHPERFSREYYKDKYEMKRIRCWACPLHHVQHIKIKKGDIDKVGMKDPEYECSAAWSSLIGNEDFESSAILSDLADRLGLDSNEAGWTMALTIECYEKGILKKKDTDGIPMNWGNVEAVKEMLKKIANRDGFGDIMAEGVMHAAKKIGGEAPSLGVYLNRGHSPRTHDARARWGDMLDYATSGVGTSESNSVSMEEPFLPQNVALSVKKGKIREFVDSLVVCNIATMTYAGTDIVTLIEALNLVTGWGYSLNDAIEMSERVANLFRVFNIRHGHKPEHECPSVRYSSVPVNGPMKGINIREHWETMIQEYYKLMGWDLKSGNPLLETLERLELEFTITDIY